MSTREKRLASTRMNPRHVRFPDLKAVLEAYGFTSRHGKGDHWVFEHGLLPYPTTVDPRRPFVLPVYVRNALKAIEAVQEKLEEDGGD